MSAAEGLAVRDMADDRREWVTWAMFVRLVGGLGSVSRAGERVEEAARTLMRGGTSREKSAAVSGLAFVISDAERDYAAWVNAIGRASAMRGGELAALEEALDDGVPPILFRAPGAVMAALGQFGRAYPVRLAKPARLEDLDETQRAVEEVRTSAAAFVGILHRERLWIERLRADAEARHAGRSRPTEKTARLRAKRRQGYVYTAAVDIHQADIEAMVEMGLLAKNETQDREAVQEAMRALVSSAVALFDPAGAGKILSIKALGPGPQKWD
jgi:hypothetical protein